MKNVYQALSVPVCLALVSGLIGGCGAYRMGAPKAPFGEMPPMPCNDLGTSARKAVREFFETNQYDSALMALQYWTDQCGVSETTARTTLLLHIAAGMFEEDLCDRWIIDNMLHHKRSPSWSQGSPYWWWYREQDKSYDEFTRRVARQLRKKTPQGSIENLLCECFSGDCDSAFIKLQQPEYQHTRLRYYYDQTVKRNLETLPEGNFAVYTGYWNPQGENRQLDAHPVFGAVMGGQSGRYLYNVAVEWRGAAASSPYRVEHDRMIDSAISFNGYYLGFEVGRELFRASGHQLFLRAGGGLDGFEGRSIPNDGALIKVNTVNINFGAAYRFFLRRYGLEYIGVEGIYNVISYGHGGGDGLQGNALEFRVMFGWAGNKYKAELLRDLNYGGR